MTDLRVNADIVAALLKGFQQQRLVEFVEK
jgi:hypothetical protein